jgi:hypothetical protein
MKTYKIKRLANKLIKLTTGLQQIENIYQMPKEGQVFIKIHNQSDVQPIIDILTKNNIKYIPFEPYGFRVLLQDNIRLIRRNADDQRRYTNEQLEEMYTRNQGNINRIAKEMGVSRQCAWQHMKLYLGKGGTYYKKKIKN